MEAKRLRRAQLEELKRTRDGAKRQYSVRLHAVCFFPRSQTRCSTHTLLFFCAHFPFMQAQESTAIYDEVDDDDYKAIVKGRLQEDDFIEDDGVGGYIDNGMDDWDEQMGEAEGDEDNGQSIAAA